MGSRSEVSPGAWGLPQGVGHCAPVASAYGSEAASHLQVLATSLNPGAPSLHRRGCPVALCLLPQ